MKFKGRFSQTFAILILGLVATSFVFFGANEAINPKNAHFTPRCEYLRNTCNLAGADCISSENNQSADPLAYLFQIIFILFFISPPLIVILLFLIWRELKTRNSLK